MRIPRRLPTEARRDPDVECTAVDIRFDLSILGAAPLDDVHVGHDLDPAHQRRFPCRPGGRARRGAPIDAHSHAYVICLWLEWMSEARSRIAWVTLRSTTLTIGACAPTALA